MDGAAELERQKLLDRLAEDEVCLTETADVLRDAAASLGILLRHSLHQDILKVRNVRWKIWLNNNSGLLTFGRIFGLFHWNRHCYRWFPPLIDWLIDWLKRKIDWLIDWSVCCWWCLFPASAGRTAYSLADHCSKGSFGRDSPASVWHQSLDASRSPWRRSLDHGIGRCRLRRSVPPKSLWNLPTSRSRLTMGTGTDQERLHSQSKQRIKFAVLQASGSEHDLYRIGGTRGEGWSGTCPGPSLSGFGLGAAESPGVGRDTDAVRGGPEGGVWRLPQTARRRRWTTKTATSDTDRHSRCLRVQHYGPKICGVCGGGAGNTADFPPDRGNGKSQQRGSVVRGGKRGGRGLLPHWLFSRYISRIFSRVCFLSTIFRNHGWQFSCWWVFFAILFKINTRIVLGKWGFWLKSRLRSSVPVLLTNWLASKKSSKSSAALKCFKGINAVHKVVFQWFMGPLKNEIVWLTKIDGEEEVLDDSSHIKSWTIPRVHEITLIERVFQSGYVTKMEMFRNSLNFIKRSILS